ncbi:MAG: AraC family ligand binding domain-containing protein [Muribaculaceae bacterium]|nr:AraC family ligand binding domain-containing protein [Muribaculaceae bacterium]
MILHKPIVFRPYFKHVIWGGKRICEYKGVPDSGSDIGESWEVSALPGQQSVVEKGEYAGMTLGDLVDRFGEQLLGERVSRKYGGKFPLLVKFIDAKEQLSVQVHPDDELALRRHDSLGKAELWYVIDSDPGAGIHIGLKEPLDADSLFNRIKEGTVMEALSYHESKEGDVYFLPPGRIHSIGPGNLLVEIQESSDITYRIYDYGRKDADGKPRQLHTEEAREAIDFSVSDSYRLLHVGSREEEKELLRCDHFTTCLYTINPRREFLPTRDSFTIIICLKGEVTVKCRDGEESIRAGHTLLIPAHTEKVTIEGQGRILTTQG